MDDSKDSKVMYTIMLGGHGTTTFFVLPSIFVETSRLIRGFL